MVLGPLAFESIPNSSHQEGCLALRLASKQIYQETKRAFHSNRFEFTRVPQLCMDFPELKKAFAANIKKVTVCWLNRRSKPTILFHWLAKFPQ
jgi:hypothetical protein